MFGKIVYISNENVHISIDGDASAVENMMNMH